MFVFLEFLLQILWIILVLIFEISNHQWNKTIMIYSIAIGYDTLSKLANLQWNIIIYFLNISIIISKNHLLIFLYNNQREWKKQELSKSLRNLIECLINYVVNNYTTVSQWTAGQDHKLVELLLIWEIEWFFINIIIMIIFIIIYTKISRFL